MSTCETCHYYYGKSDGGNYLHCPLHPYGVDDICADHQKTADNLELEKVVRKLREGSFLLPEIELSQLPLPQGFLEEIRLTPEEIIEKTKNNLLSVFAPYNCFIRCDESNNSPESISEGIINCDVLFEVVHRIKINVKRSSLSSETETPEDY